LLRAEELGPKIDALVAKAGVTADTPGVAILVVEKGHVVFDKGYGLANLKDKTPIRRETTFELASLSKPFTATAILLLHERGDLSIHDDVRKYVPEVPLYDKAHPIHVIDLLRHTSGLPEYFGVEGVKGRNPKFITNEDYARDMAARPEKYPQGFAAGAKFEYCNTNYMLLSLIVQRVSKKSYGAFLHDEIFKPHGMSHSWVYEDQSGAPRHGQLGFVNALGYTHNKAFNETWGSPPLRTETLLTTGDGGVWTNLEDMQHFDAAVRQGKLLKAETMRLALTPSKTRDGKTKNYGLGWGLVLDSSGKPIAQWHNGSWGGFRTNYFHSLTDEVSIIILSNRSDMEPEKLSDQIHELLRTRRPGK
jgi:CubicO group peptidase (beta-lactamase class C family)